MIDKNFGYDVDLFGTDFEAIKNNLLEMCEFYTNQHLPYIHNRGEQKLGVY